MADSRKLVDIVNRPEWDGYMVWLDQKRVECIDKLENCQPEKLGRIQGELAVIKEMLTLRNTVNSLR